MNNGQHIVKKVTVKEYLYHAEFGSDRLREAICSIISGDLLIHSNHVISELPPVEASGKIIIKDCPRLRRCDVRTADRLEIHNCPQLKDLKGSVGEAFLDKCGLKILGADFECDGDLKILRCDDFAKVNCRVGGVLRIEGDGIVSAGPAFSCDSALLLEGGVAFFSWSKEHCDETHGVHPRMDEFELRKGHSSRSPNTKVRREIDPK